MEKNPAIFLRHIVESIETIESYAAGKTFETFLDALKDQDAVMRRIEIIGEATRNLPDGFKVEHPEIPWKKIAGMRNMLIHEYFIVDLKAVWDTVHDDLPLLKRQIRKLLEQ